MDLIHFAPVRTLLNVWTDHCYCRALDDYENDYGNWNEAFVKKEPIDTDDNELPEAECDELQEKQCADQVSCPGFGFEARIPTKADVWLDHCYTRVLNELKHESHDSYKMIIKEEPITADDSNCYDKVLPIIETDALPATVNLNFAFAVCETDGTPTVLGVLLEHSYASPPDGKELDEGEGRGTDDLMESDPLTLDQEAIAEPGLQEPSEDFLQRFSEINDVGKYQQQSEAINQEAGTIKRVKLHDRSFQINIDNLPIFECWLCHQSFESYHNFGCHLVICHAKSFDGRHFTCNFCTSTFMTCQSLITHMNSAHGCLIKASNLFNTRTASVPSHSESLPKAENTPFSCHACMDLFVCEADLKIHFMLDKCALSCIECQRVFISAAALLLHKENVHPELLGKCRKTKYNCTRCDEAFPTSGDLLTHLMLRSCERKFACESCDSVFLTAGHLSEHADSFACQLSKRLSNDSAVLQAEASNSVAAALHCHLCGEVLSSTTDLTRHFVTNHFNSLQYFYEASDSPSGLTTRSAATVTSKTMLNTDRIILKERFTCRPCDKTFKSKILLQCHEEIHKKRLDPTCVECERCFTFTSNLKKHLVRCSAPANLQDRLSTIKVDKVQPKTLAGSAHLKGSVRKKTCDLCRKEFSTKRELVIHLQSHTTERNFGCLECNEYFTHVRDFMRHTMRCSKTFVKQNKQSFKLAAVVKKKRSKVKAKRVNKRRAKK